MPQITEVNFSYQVYYQGRVEASTFKHGRCIIRIWERAPGRSIVVITEPQDMPTFSPTITNAAEAIASAVVRNFNVDPRTTIWFEHLPSYSSERLGRPYARAEEFDQITFEWTDDTAVDAHWTNSSRAAVEALIGAPLAPRTTLAEAQEAA